jgi:non-ribosomal peptide synthetase component E (peptide arylation enzyme)
VTDADGNAVGVDEVGELRLRGPNVMKGYLNVDDGSFDAEGFYRTGYLRG